MQNRITFVNAFNSGIVLPGLRAGSLGLLTSSHGNAASDCALALALGAATGKGCRQKAGVLFITAKSGKEMNLCLQDAIDAFELDRRDCEALDENVRIFSEYNVRDCICANPRQSVFRAVGKIFSEFPAEQSQVRPRLVVLDMFDKFCDHREFSHLMSAKKEIAMALSYVARNEDLAMLGVCSEKTYDSCGCLANVSYCARLVEAEGIRLPGGERVLRLLCEKWKGQRPEDMYYYIDPVSGEKNE